MHIAIIHSRLNSKGGTQRKALATACALQELGYTVTVYAMAYDPEQCYPALLSGLIVIALPRYNDKAQKTKIPFLKFLNYFLYSRNETRAASRLAETIKRDTEILCSFDKLAYRVAAHYKNKIQNIPSVAIMDDIYTKLWAEWRKSQFDPMRRLTWRRKFFYSIVDWFETRKYILPHERIIVLDRRTKKWVGEYFHKDADIVRNGLEPRDFPYTPHVFSKKSKVRLLSVGIFFVHRRYEDIIQAVKLLQEKGIDATLSIAGSFGGEHRHYFEKLQVLAYKLGVSGSLLFLGNVSDAELRKQYAENDIYISANHLQSWGLAPFEAMASGMPAIISNTTGAAEVLTDHKHARLIPPKNPEKIAAAVKELVENSDLYAVLSKEGRRFVETEITWQNTAKELTKVLEECFHMSEKQ